MPAARSSPSEPYHVLIVGAGLTGLVFAQGLRRINHDLKAQGFPPKYTFCIYERDESQMVRGGGFSLTIHWALPYLLATIPKDLASRILECVGNQRAMESGEMGYFTYLNLRTGDALHRNPVPEGWTGARMARIKLINLLMTGLDVRFSKRLKTLSFPNTEQVSAHFEDGSIDTGDLLIGADGSNSAVRRMLYGTEKAKNTQLPVRMINTRCRYPLEQLKDCLAIDPHTFHGGDPLQNGYFFFAFLDLPRAESGQSTASVQMTFTWPYEQGYLDESNASNPPEDHAGRLLWLRRIAKHWVNPVRDLIRNMPDDSTIIPVTIAEWLPSSVTANPTNGRVAMVGDAGHLMTSFRGENANHGVVDVANIVAALAVDDITSSEFPQIVKDYETEMRNRTGPATVQARQACLDANRYSRVKAGSPFLARRAMIVDDL